MDSLFEGFEPVCVCVSVSVGGQGVKMASLLKFSGFSFAFLLSLHRKHFLMQHHESVGIYSHEKEH